MIDRGRVIADGTPEELKARVGGSQVDVVVRDARRCRSRRWRVERVVRAVRWSTATGAGSPARRASRSRRWPACCAALEDVGVEAEDVALRRPTLDEVFLQLTGRPEAVAA